MKKLIVKKSIAINAPASKVWSIIVFPERGKWMLALLEDSL
jgi:hypothetical protein